MGTCEVLEWDEWFTASSRSLENFGTVGQPLEPPFLPTGGLCVRLGVTPEKVLKSWWDPAYGRGRNVILLSASYK